MHQRIISIPAILTMGLGLVVASCSSSSSTSALTPEGGTPPGTDGGGPNPDGGPGPGMDGGPGGNDSGPGGNDSGNGGNDSGGNKDSGGGGKDSGSGGGHAIKTVFIIMEENHNWSSIKGSSSAPYINNILLPAGSYANNYKTPPGNHPSEPNYLWLEGGTNFNVTDDSDPAVNTINSTAHLVTLMKNAGVTWKAYVESAPSACPLTSGGLFAAKHTPQLFFDDVTNTLNPGAYCDSHIVDFSQLASDISANTVAQYNFITPNLVDDMHSGSIGAADSWLKTNIPMIQASSAYTNGGVILVIWDEGASSSDGPMGMIVVSSLSKGNGYSNNIAYTHSATLRTVQEIFSLSPFLGDAANGPDLSDLFKTFP